MQCSAAQRDAWDPGTVALAWRPTACRDGIYHGHKHGITTDMDAASTMGTAQVWMWHQPWARARCQLRPWAWRGHGHQVSHGMGKATTSAMSWRGHGHHISHGHGGGIHRRHGCSRHRRQACGIAVSSPDFPLPWQMGS